MLTRGARLVIVGLLAAWLAAGISACGPTGDLRTQLVRGLRGTDDVAAGIVGNPSTDLVVVPTDWLPGWRVVRVGPRFSPHAVPFHLAVSDGGVVRPLRESADFNALVSGAGVRLADPLAAVDAARLHVDVTPRGPTFGRVEKVDDVPWLESVNATQRSIQDRVGERVQPPRAQPAGTGWTMTVWTVDQPDPGSHVLVSHDLTVAADGVVSDRTQVVVRDLPVPTIF